MAKKIKRMFDIDPKKVIESKFREKNGRTSESIFSLGNEYMGIRGQFDETYSGDKLIGSYFNGVYEEKPLSYPEYFNGLSTRCCFMINACNWLYTRIFVDGTELDLHKVPFSDFHRELDMEKALLTRSVTALGVTFTFERFVSINHHYIGGQQIKLQTRSGPHKIEIISGIDFNPIHEEEGKNFWQETETGDDFIMCRTINSQQSIYSKFKTNLNPVQIIKTDKKVAQKYEIHLDSSSVFQKVVYNYASRGDSDGRADPNDYFGRSYDEYRQRHIDKWADIWKHSDIRIDGDPENQQGIRFCIFNMHQTYHGDDGQLNIGAKGLTGEKYSGWTFWDSETYCLPFYIFNNLQAAKNLLLYRYNTLPQAMERAQEQDCKGACFPMVTIDGTESCGVWQHGNLEIHVSAAISYGVWHYMQNTKDVEFLKHYGLKLLVETSRYFASRGGWSPKTGEFGLYGVMGPDEFHMMVHNNTYTNYMVKKMFYYTIDCVEQYGYPVDPAELHEWKAMADHMRINYDSETKLYEQHDGYFDLPEEDVQNLDPERVPIYKYWAYDRIFRCNMLKQPDVVLMQLFFSNDFTLEQKRKNYYFYEKRCSHESSLSPAIHSIMAAEIGDMELADNYMSFGSRLDLDDYNRNTHQGLHITSMAAAWMNIVYGFAGMRSDGTIVSFKPSIPQNWDKYSFKLTVCGSLIEIEINKQQACFTLLEGNPVYVKIFDTHYTIGKEVVGVAI